MKELNRKLQSVMLALTLMMLPLLTLADTIHGNYQQHNLVSDGFAPADTIDPHLVNPWGLAFGDTNPVWVANNGTGTSTIYDGLGNMAPLIVNIKSPTTGATSSPTGIVYNNTHGWLVTQGNKRAASIFIFATEDGLIGGWSPTIDTTNVIIAVDNSASGAVYKGLARGNNGKQMLLYAANFRSGKVEAFDDQFKPVQLPGGFEDRDLPKGYAPFGIQNVGGNIYVTYAKQDSEKKDEVKGKGFGFVNVFDTNGHLIRRVASRGTLNAPWGIALAPAGFGAFSNTLLIGNFGDGRINSFDYASDRFLGHLHESHLKPLEIDGLWGLAFGNGLRSQPTTTLFFTAGPMDETHGLYGTITPHD